MGCSYGRRSSARTGWSLSTRPWKRFFATTERPAKHGQGDPLFLARTGKPLAYTTVVAAFLHLSRQLGLRGGPGEPGGRIHDLRHSFAVRSLERCAGTTASVSRHMLALSTYLGHAHVSDTYYYLQATPALLEQIATMSEATMELTS